MTAAVSVALSMWANCLKQLSGYTQSCLKTRETFTWNKGYATPSKSCDQAAYGRSKKSRCSALLSIKKKTKLQKRQFIGVAILKVLISWHWSLTAVRGCSKFTSLCAWQDSPVVCRLTLLKAVVTIHSDMLRWLHSSTKTELSCIFSKTVVYSAVLR